MTLFQSHLEYGIVPLGRLPRNMLRTLISLQKNVLEMWQGLRDFIVQKPFSARKWAFLNFMIFLILSAPSLCSNVAKACFLHLFYPSLKVYLTPIDQIVLRQKSVKTSLWKDFQLFFLPRIWNANSLSVRLSQSLDSLGKNYKLSKQNL